MLGIVSKGIIIGVLVSAPMGPIGMLCIQRTLNKGRWHGFVTGLGAALSDVIYAALNLSGHGSCGQLRGGEPSAPAIDRKYRSRHFRVLYLPKQPD